MFIPRIEGKEYVNHKDGDKDNNAANNLEWVTQKENQDHAVQTGLCPRGEDIPTAKLTEKEVLQICELLCLPLPLAEVSKRTGKPVRIIKRIKARDTWAWLTKDFIFFTGRPKLSLLNGERDKIIELLKTGMSSRKLAEMFGVSKGVILQIRRESFGTCND